MCRSFAGGTRRQVPAAWRMVHSRCCTGNNCAKLDQLCTSLSVGGSGVTNETGRERAKILRLQKRRRKLVAQEISVGGRSFGKSLGRRHYTCRFKRRLNVRGEVLQAFVGDLMHDAVVGESS